jgi:hypothetical protein
MKVKLDTGAENSEQVIAEICTLEEPYLVRGLWLIQVDSLGSSLIEVSNTGPIAREQVIEAAKNVSGQNMTHKLKR